MTARMDEPRLPRGPAPRPGSAAAGASRARGVWVRRAAVVILPAILLAAAAWSLRDELAGLDLREVERELGALPGGLLLAAAAVTAVDYVLLSGYDVLALRYAGRKLPYPRVLFTSFIAYAFGNNVGFALVSSGSVRLRLYSQWGLTPGEVARVVGFTAAQLWAGLLPLAGVALLAGAPIPLPPVAARALGVISLGAITAYLALAARGREYRLRGVQFRLPSLPLAAGQVAVSAADWALAALVLHVLLPAGEPLSYPALLGLFVAAQVAGLASQLPGGVGVFDAVVLAALVPALPAPAVVSSLLAYRLIYYLLPFAAAFALLAANELLAHRTRVRRLLLAAHGSFAPVVPWMAAAAAMLAGAVLLLSAIAPSAPDRLHALRRVVPLPLLEASHLTGSLVGTALLIVARGLARRLSGAWALAIALLAAGAIASLLKGLDWEEALVLTGVLLALLPFRAQFYRESTLLAQPAGPAWLLATGTVLAASIGIGLFAYRHVEYTGDLWFQFAFRGDAPRFLRASVVAGSALALFALARLLRPAPPEPTPPGEADWPRLRELVDRAPAAEAHLALVGDKAILFAPAGGGFLMYGVEGRSWVSMGDPVGPDRIATELAWQLRQLADRHGGWACFYQVGAAHLPRYLDLGLGLFRLGEEAVVPLGSFSLDAPGRRALRQAYHDAAREGLRFDVVPAADVPHLLPALRVVSDAWLAAKGVREKGFALGSFDPRYLCEGPVATVSQGGRVVGFGNLWAGSNRTELSVDLMRHLDDAPHGTMEFLLTSILSWGRAQGYGWFNLGMAPLSGLADQALAPLWTRLGARLYRHGEHFHDLQELRRYKERFAPEWRPRFLAAPGGLRLPLVLANLAALVARSLGGVLAR
jgi:phosphatidylglycerol lysyltransferase